MRDPKYDVGHEAKYTAIHPNRAILLPTAIFAPVRIVQEYSALGVEFKKNWVS